MDDPRVRLRRFAELAKHSETQDYIYEARAEAPAFAKALEAILALCDAKRPPHNKLEGYGLGWLDAINSVARAIDHALQENRS